VSIKNLPRACTTGSVQILVDVKNRRGPQTTVVYLNGHRIAKSNKLRFAVTLPISQIAVGRDMVKVRTTSHGRSMTVRGVFSRCVPVPRFTG
jgi:hypothetical protein